MENTGEVLIYRAEDGAMELNVKLENETVWLTQAQMAKLFGKTTDNIGLHIKNIYKEGELEARSTTEESSVVQNEGGRNVKRNVSLYNLDVIISVGYRVRSKQGTKFRIWATNTLRNHLVQGYTLNEKRLREREQGILDLEKHIKFITGNTDIKKLSKSEAKGLLEIIEKYTNSWILLNKFDHGELSTDNLKTENIQRISYVEALESIRQLRNSLAEREEIVDLFGNEHSKGLDKILATLDQTFDGNDLYSSIEEKAANLLYLVIKDHPFSDGNKRIGSFLFILYLQKNNYLIDDEGERKFNDNALVALALLIAQSDPKDKDVMVDLVINLVKGR